MSKLSATFSNPTAGLVAILNNRPDFERARLERWYRIPVRTAPDDLPNIEWIAFYLTQAFGAAKWAVRYWAKVEGISQVPRVELLPGEPAHPRANELYNRLKLGELQMRPEPIFSRRRRRIVFIPSIWKKFATALEVNDLVHGSPLEDRLWAAFKQENVDTGAERQWWEGTRKTRYCLDFALFCPDRNIDVECDGDRWHSTPERTPYDNARNNFLEQRGWHVLRFNTRQLKDDISGCVRAVKNTIDRCGGLLQPDNSVHQFGSPIPDGSRQLKLF